MRALDRIIRVLLVPALALGLALGLVGCATISEKLRAQIASGSFDDAIEEGNEWLREDGTKEPTSRRTREVKLLVAEASLGKAHKLDTVGAYRQFKIQFSRGPLFKPILARATDLEAKAYFRDRVLGKPSINKHRLFRRTYPGSSLISESRRREVPLGLARAERGGTIASYRFFHDTYGHWPEAKDALITVHTRESSLAFKAVKEEGTITACGRFRERYRSWKEARMLVARARQLELKLAYEAARTHGTVSTYRAFRKSYGAWPEGKREVAAARKAELAKAWKDTTRTNTIALYRDFRDQYSLWPEAADLVRQAYKAEVSLAWAKAQSGGSWMDYRSFAGHYPQDHRAASAERTYHRLRRMSEADGSWPRAAIQHRRVLPSGEIELHVDVRDCLGRRISGLTRGQFDVMFDGGPAQITGFRGLEDDRPLDIVFGLDLSGSMATERAAVSEALLRFAETFRFRGRRARLGLIGFSDELFASHRPSPRPSDFRRWMAKLPMGGGGSGEDGTHALLKGADMPLARGAERVFIMITDESLQMNQGGRAALKLGDGTTAVCTRLAKISSCFGKCKSASCRCRCYMKLGRREARDMRRCLRRFGARRCGASIPYHRYLRAGTSCGEPVLDGSVAMTKLVDRLRKQRARVFFVVPRMDGPSPITGFDTLARGLFGRILHVPQNSTSPGDYVQALMDIADQLSKQYVIRVDPTVQAPAHPAIRSKKASLARAAAVSAATALLQRSRVQVGVRRMHVWNSLGTVQTGQVSRLLPVKGGKAACPAFWVITSQKTLAWTSACGGPFKAVTIPGGGTVQSTITVAGRVLLITSRGRLLEAETANKAPRDVATGMARVRAAAVNGGFLAVLGQDGSGKWKLAVQGSGGTALDHPNDAPLAAGRVHPPPIVLSGRAGQSERVCLLLTPTLMKCSADHGGTWQDRRVTGLPPTALENPVQLHTGAGQVRVHLLATADGAVYRSLDRSLRWQASIAASSSSHRLVAIPGLPRGVCAWSGSRLICSDDMGLRWFHVGHQATGTGPHAIAAHGHELFVVGGGRFYRLDRVANRELAASSIYFTTNSDKPQAALLPFLKQVAVNMRTDLTALLRIEGHADKRGSKAYNEDLARRRAKEVADRVMSYGVKRKRIMVLSFGELRPLSQGSSAVSLARNRRVEILLMRRIPAGGWTLDICAAQGGAASWEQRRREAEQAMGELERREAPVIITRMRKQIHAIARRCAPVKAQLRRINAEIRRARDMGARLKLAVKRDAMTSKLKVLRRRLDGLRMTAVVRAGLASEIAALKAACSP